MHVSGGVLLSNSFLILIFLAGMEAWNFIHTGTQPSSGTRMRFLLFKLVSSPSPGPTRRQNSKESLKSVQRAVPSLPYPRHLQNVMRTLFGVEMKTLLPKPSKENKAVENFFLIFPRRASDELKLYVDFLVKSGAKSAFSSHQDGAWDYFRHHYEFGVILVSSSLVSESQIPLFQSTQFEVPPLL